MRCPNCHNKIDDDSKFCPNCGHAISKEKICPKCGQVNAPDSKFCKACGTPLNEKKAEELAKEEENSKPIEIRATKKDGSKISKDSLWGILSLVSMALMLLSILLMTGMAFAPYLKDDFFPDSMFTFIGFASNVFANNIEEVKTSFEYVSFAHGFISIFLLIAIVLTGLAFFILGMIKFTDMLKNKKYFDFSKYVLIPYILFLGIFVFSANSMFNLDGYNITTYAGGMLFAIIFVPIVLIFNLCVKEISEDKHNASALFIRSLVRVLIFVFVFITIFNLDTTHFNFFARTQHSSTYTSESFVSNNIALINWLVKNAHNVAVQAQPAMINFVVELGVSFVLETIALVVLVQLLFRPLSRDLKKNNLNVAGIATSASALVLICVSLILNVAARDVANTINSTDFYLVEYEVSLISTHHVVAIVFASLTLLTYISSFLLEEKVLGEQK